MPGVLWLRNLPTKPSDLPMSDAAAVYTALCQYLVRRLESGEEVSKDELTAAGKLIEDQNISQSPVNIEDDEVKKRLAKAKEAKERASK